jgi:putative membrane protein
MHNATKKARSKNAWLFAAASAILASAWLFFLSKNGSYHPSFTTWWWIFCGVLWGLGIVIPGLSPSSLFLIVNTYKQMSEGIGDLNFAIILPMAVGLIITVASLSRFMNRLLSRWYAQVMHAILGIIFVFTIAILIDIVNAGIGNALLCVICFGVGFAVAFGMESLSGRMDDLTKT